MHKHEGTKKRVMSLVNKWTKPLGLRWWQIEVLWVHKEFERGDKTVLFSTAVSWEYRTAWITAFLPALKREPEKSLERSVVHELCHILVAELQSAPKADKQRHCESVVTALSHAFLWTREMTQSGEME